MSWSAAIITKRFPVWDVLSEFWLDGELQEEDFIRIAAELKKSQYSKQELFRICLYEVAPAVSGNLFNIAGVWGAFDPDWLTQAIINKSPNPDDFLQPGVWKRFKGMVHASFIKSSGWEKVARQL
ncbi:MAG: hypothetical protein OEZ39_09275 [Gammaproteobacteria bacterium]|nr:hypothetical protein [Gammaproteobacteria bacterium]MDH5652035.1 hypothetical protein [Gammaproteobacteria bacterium]